jgi:hypothetical protein
MRIRRALEISIGLVALLLLWQIGMTWRRPLPPPLAESAPSQGQAPKTRPPSRATPDSLAPQVQLIAAKNLFDPQRGHVEVVTTTEPTKVVPPPSHLKLVGIVVSRSRTEAMVTDATQGGKAVRVKQGDTLGEYQLVSVTPTEVKLGLGTDGGEVTLALAILESGLAAQAPQMMMSPDQQAGIPPGRHRDLPLEGAQQEPPLDPNGDNAPQEEAQALRENIQQMQQRLRQIRRRAAIDEARSRGETIEEDAGEEEE